MAESEIRDPKRSQVLILELERFVIDAVGVEDVDWRFSLLQDMMDSDEATQVEATPPRRILLRAEACTTCYDKRSL
jgi:hypothetical protein